jgi:hypothetical protein
MITGLTILAVLAFIAVGEVRKTHEPWQRTTINVWTSEDDSRLQEAHARSEITIRLRRSCPIDRRLDMYGARGVK